VVPGRSVSISYLPEPYDLSAWPEDRRPSAKELDAATHVIRSYLVLYREPAELVDAPVLRVTNVSPGSAAAEVGIRAGDYLATYDGERVDSVDALAAAKKAATDEGRETVEVVVYRGSERLELTIAAGQIGVNLSER
jgi:S1-C subfamily serine protease